MIARLSALLALLALVAAAVASGGSAGKPGSWTRITDTNDRNIDQVGFARTPDGVLHVVWIRRSATGEGVMHTPISKGGAVGAAANVLGGFKSVGNPDAVVMPNGSLRAFFPGLGTTLQEGGVVSAAAPASGAGWARDGIRDSSTTSAVGSVGAAVAGDGSPVFSYALSFVLGFHVGLNPGVKDVNLAPDNRCCDYLPDLATDSQSKATYIAWFSNASGRTGVFAQRVVPTTGPREMAPGSAQGDSAVGPDVRTAITARIGAPGVYVAYCSGYPSCKRVLLWRLGGGVLKAGGSPDVEDVAVSAAPEGRLWVTWHDGQNALRILARRTNKAVTRLGPVVTVKPPPKTSSIWKLGGDGALGPLDLFASVSTGATLSTWHTQVLPPLTLGATVNQKTHVAKLTVVDAGDPVAGAKVSVGGKTLTTDAGGHASTKLSPGTYGAIATKKGYAPAKATVHVKQTK